MITWCLTVLSCPVRCEQSAADARHHDSPRLRGRPGDRRGCQALPLWCGTAYPPSLTAVWRRRSRLSGGGRLMCGVRIPGEEQCQRPVLATRPLPRRKPAGGGDPVAGGRLPPHVPLPAIATSEAQCRRSGRNPDRVCLPPSGRRTGRSAASCRRLRPVLRVALTVQPHGVELLDCIATSQAEFS